MSTMEIVALNPNPASTFTKRTVLHNLGVNRPSENAKALAPNYGISVLFSRNCLCDQHFATKALRFEHGGSVASANLSVDTLRRCYAVATRSVEKYRKGIL